MADSCIYCDGDLDKEDQKEGNVFHATCFDDRVLEEEAHLGIPMWNSYFDEQDMEGEPIPCNCDGCELDYGCEEGDEDLI
jgi:hypothetical protein